MSHRVDRSLLLEHDPAKIAPVAIESLKDANWTHQQAAAVAGYNSVYEMAVDELLVMVRELSARCDRFERDLTELRQGTLFGEIVP